MSVTEPEKRLNESWSRLKPFTKTFRYDDSSDDTSDAMVLVCVYAGVV